MQTVDIFKYINDTMINDQSFIINTNSHIKGRVPPYIIDKYSVLSAYYLMLSLNITNINDISLMLQYLLENWCLYNRKNNKKYKNLDTSIFNALLFPGDCREHAYLMCFFLNVYKYFNKLKDTYSYCYSTLIYDNETFDHVFCIKNNEIIIDIYYLYHSENRLMNIEDNYINLNGKKFQININNCEIFQNGKFQNKNIKITQKKWMTNIIPIEYNKKTITSKYQYIEMKDLMWDFYKKIDFKFKIKNLDYIVIYLCLELCQRDYKFLWNKIFGKFNLNFKFIQINFKNINFSKLNNFEKKLNDYFFSNIKLNFKKYDKINVIKNINLCQYDKPNIFNLKDRYHQPGQLVIGRTHDIIHYIYNNDYETICINDWTINKNDSMILKYKNSNLKYPIRLILGNDGFNKTLLREINIINMKYKYIRNTNIIIFINY